MKIKPLLAGLGLAGVSMFAGAEAPTYLQIPTPRGTRVSVARWAVSEAKLLGYEGVVIGIGTDQTQDPAKTDWTGFQATVNDALRDGLHVHLRLLQNVPVAAYQNGVRIGVSAWVTTYNGGVSWNQPYRPPLRVCPYIAKLVWQRATDILYDACLANGRQPSLYGSEELANEPCVGGAGGPFYGTNFSSGVWPALPQGTIEPYFWKMLRTLRYSFTARGFPTYAATLEGTAGTVGQTEVDSVVGADAQRVSDGCTGWSFNRYVSASSPTPAYAAQWWTSRAMAQIARMRANPIIGNKPLFLTEFGMKNSKMLIESLDGGSDVVDYRLAVMRAERSLPGIVGGGWFLAVSTNSMGDGYQLFNADETPVGGLVGPSIGEQ